MTITKTILFSFKLRSATRSTFHRMVTLRNLARQFASSITGAAVIEPGSSKNVTEFVLPGGVVVNRARLSTLVKDLLDDVERRCHELLLGARLPDVIALAIAKEDRRQRRVGFSIVPDLHELVEATLARHHGQTPFLVT
jgi:hypothetical protein